MTIEEALKAYLQAIPAISTLIGTRIYPNKLPQEPVLPAVKFKKYLTEHNHLIGSETAYIQYTCVATTYLGAEALLTAFRNALQREKRIMSGIEVMQISVDEDIGPEVDDIAGEYYSIITFKVNYRRYS